MSQAANGYPTPPGRPAGAAAPRPVVLVIDDSRVIRRAIAKTLADEFELIEAEDGEAGWAHIAADPRIQVVITDVEMPKLDGYGLLGRLRAAEEPRLRDLPAIVLTGAQDEQSRARAFACGATDFVIKPIDGVQLLARTRTHARLDQATRKLNETAKSLEEHTAIDPLTELHSRRYLLQRAKQDLAFARRHRQDLALIRIEFDNFRAIYQHYGDEICDQMFIWLAGLMRANTRTEDTPARIRGGEFAILAPCANHREASALCERLRAAAAATPFKLNGVAVPLTISLGVATLAGDNAETVDELLARAEERLTQARADAKDAPAPVHALPPVKPPAPNLETALALLARGDEEELTPHLPELLGRVLPLLELCDRRLGLGLAAPLAALRERAGLVK